MQEADISELTRKGDLVIEDRVEDQTRGKQEGFIDHARSYQHLGNEPGETLCTVQQHMLQLPAYVYLRHVEMTYSFLNSACSVDAGYAYVLACNIIENPSGERTSRSHCSLAELGPTSVEC